MAKSQAIRIRIINSIGSDDEAAAVFKRRIERMGGFKIVTVNTIIGGWYNGPRKELRGYHDKLSVWPSYDVVVLLWSPPDGDLDAIVSGLQHHLTRDNGREARCAIIRCEKYGDDESTWKRCTPFIPATTSSDAIIKETILAAARPRRRKKEAVT